MSFAKSGDKHSPSHHPASIAGMKKAETGARDASTKGNVPPKSVEDYLAGVPEPARSTLKKVRAAIRSALPADATEGISYRIPTFKYKGSLVWYAAFSKHCSLFPGSLAVLKAFKSELKDFHTSKGTIHFPLGQASAGDAAKKDCEGTAGGEGSQVTALCNP
jgi:uncharacterized protein YdhG (YjbR/CyaY superfamily)